MKLSRRDCIQIGAVGVAGAALGGCSPLANHVAPHPEELPLPTGDIRAEVRLLNRAGFGPRPGDIARVDEVGYHRYLEAQLAGGVEEPLSLRLQLQREDVGQIEDPDLEDLPQGEVIRQLQQSTILRAVYGENQLEERMVDFWSNHFNIYARKGDSAFRIGADERDVIRNHALGNFKELLWASAHSVAMLAFLDNPQNLNRHPNENYGRELMELHTLGVGGGYTQHDVQEVSRCFTGWTIETRFLHPKGRLRFDPEHHDDGSKLVLGHVIPAGGGPTDARLVLRILADHPSTRHFIASKLVTYFHGEDNRALCKAVSEAYRQTGGDIPSMIRMILQPKALLDAPPKIKRPLDLIASAVSGHERRHRRQSRHSRAPAGDGRTLYQWPMPDGYPVKTAAWTGSLLPRWNFAYAFAHGRIRGTSPGQVHDVREDTLGSSSRNAGRIESLAKDEKRVFLACVWRARSFNGVESALRLVELRWTWSSRDGRIAIGF